MSLSETLRTERLVMRLPRVDDAPAIHAGYATDPDVMRHLCWGPHATVSETEQYLESLLERTGSGELRPWILTLREDGRIVGALSLRCKAAHAYEVGYVLEQASWGRGYATEALVAAVAEAFRSPDVVRVDAICHWSNEASMRVLEKAGFRREGLLRRYAVFPNLCDEPQDATIHAVVR